jgi:hypothetical protein
MPDIPDLQQVGGAASQNERAKHPKNAIEGKVPMLANEINQDDRDGVVRKCDQAIRNDVQPKNLRIPEIAVAMRHEIRWGGGGCRLSQWRRPQKNAGTGNHNSCLGETR